MTKVFIDGSQGTTGLRIFDRLSLREDIELITLKESERKDLSCRIKAINSSDITFLCLPDEAAIEAVSHADEKVKILDTSTAHRTNEQWIYGFPEVFENGLEKVKGSNRVAVPGCHASGYIALIKPLIDNGILSKDTLLTCHSVTGYSGGGKKMIAEYECADRNPLLGAPRQYALTQQHKHLKEMQAKTGLVNAPMFSPIVADFYSGMVVTVPLFKAQLLKGGAEDIKAVYREKYANAFVQYTENLDENGLLSGLAVSGKDCMKVTVAGNEERILLIAGYDNLGKGASGAAIECMNMAIGADREKGLIL